MWQEIILIKNVLVRSLFLFIALGLVFFAVPFVEQEGRYGLSIPVPQYQSGQDGVTFSEFAITHIQTSLVPEGVTLVTASPLDPFTTKAMVAVTAALAIVIPFLFFEIWCFVRPALYPRERQTLSLLLLFSLSLFIFGAIFSYVLIIPLVFSALFSYLPPEILPFYNVKELIAIVNGLMLATGVIFLLPVAMTLFTRFGFIPAYFWRSYARHAVLLVLILSAIITPDGSGISMVLLALPVCGLYAVGYAGSTFLEPKRRKREGTT